MVEENKNILFENLLDEPESTLATGITLGDTIVKSTESGEKGDCTSDKAGDGCKTDICADACNSDTSPSYSAHFQYVVGFKLMVIGTYGTYNDWPLYRYLLPTGWPHTSTVNASDFQANLASIGALSIKNQLDANLSQSTLKVYKSGVTFYAGTSQTVNICGTTISVSNPTGLNNMVSSLCTGKIATITSSTHMGQANIPITGVAAVWRINSSASPIYNPNPVNLALTYSGVNSVYFCEKCVAVTVVDNENLSYRLQNAAIDLSNGTEGCAVPNNIVRTGNLGYIRLYTSGNTSSTFTVNVSRIGYETTSMTFNYGNANPAQGTINGNTVRLSKNYYEVPAMKDLFINLLQLTDVQSTQCVTSSYLTGMNPSFSAITGSIYQQTSFTGIQALRYVDVKSLLPSIDVYQDDAIQGKDNILTYNITNTNTIYDLETYHLIYTFTGFNNSNRYEIQTPKIAITAQSGNYSMICAQFRMVVNGNTGNFNFCSYAKTEGMVATACTLSSRTIIPRTGNLLENASFTATLEYLITTTVPASLTANITAQTVTGSYKYTSNTNSNVVPPEPPPVG